MSCDGSIDAVGGRPRIELTVASPQLAADIHHAFIRFGLVAKHSRTTHGAYRVEITDPASVKRYQEQIGWLGEKRTRFMELVQRGRAHPGSSGHLPKAAWALVRAAAQRHGLAMIELARRGGETTKTGAYAGYNPQKYAGYNPPMTPGLPRYRPARYAEVRGDQHL